MLPTGLPSAPLVTSRPLGARFAAQGAWTFRDAARLVWALPYGRPAGRGLDAVLRDGRGTSGSKHALLAALAAEVGLPVGLRLGLFQMSNATTPGVGAVLRRYGLASVPEARVVLDADGDRVDLTWPGERRPVPAFSEEETIRPDQAGAYAEAWHRERLDAWAEAEGLDPNAVWRAREAAIEALIWR